VDGKIFKKLNQPYIKRTSGMRIKQYLFTIIFIVSFVFYTKACADETSRANFIIIYADDMGYADAGPFGDPKINTPAIDALVENGQTWTNFYATAPVCTPSRGALLTGKLPVRTGLYGDTISVFFPGSKQGLPHSEKTIAEVFQDNKYSTGMFGKWHLGDAPAFYPTRHGFDEWLGIPYSNDMDWEIDGVNFGNIFTPPEGAPAKWKTVAPRIRKNIFKREITDWHVPLISSQHLNDGTFKDTLLEKPANQNLITKRYTEESVRFMAESVEKNKPFFLFLSHSMPHVPLFRSPDFVNKSQQGIYGDVIEEIDWSIGEILSSLKRLNVNNNTYVIFTSDNGPWLLFGDHAGSAKPLRDGKGTTFEGGMRAMTMFSGPGIKPGIVSEIGVQTDLFTTLLSLAKITNFSLPQDSFDLTGALLKGEQSPRDFVPFYRGSELRAFRVNEHKIHFITEGAYNRPPKKQFHSTPLLINLNENIGEREDLMTNEKAITAKLIERATRFQQSFEKAPSILDRQFQ